MKAATGTRLTADIAFEGGGKRQGYIRLPLSTHDSAYGFVPIPVVVIAGAPGPTTLLTAGNHGDEYEGEVALANLARALSPDDIAGRLVILPALNLPAALAGRRVSPIDGGNLNRAFPGDPAGGATAQIAWYVERVLMPLCDVACDLHSGGSSLHYLPSTVIPHWADPARFRRSLALVWAFAAPHAYVLDEPEADAPTLLGAAARGGKLFLGTELGGSGTLGAATLAVAEGGLRRLLGHLGHLPEAAAESPPVRILRVGGADYFVHADDDGVAEPLVELGEDVAAGQPAARIHTPEKPWAEPVTLRFARAGMVLCRRAPARVKRGDCLFHLGTDSPWPEPA
ncbi:succinylglutamate desuccinylase/aspartoacylase family protein [Labrys wisconsinensis]|uniref:Deacylase n=1 Tax=Labrys wisconsinensis TaxID=425677 RepID=A0ABU0JJF0_9HYPH|nr:succinylglutamate desuccinylase/aspartoacylase family protein [Labrys wisconsinensis]MDQ0474379.1 putative deacylase [Labrys wisconsinensis]